LTKVAFDFVIQRTAVRCQCCQLECSFSNAWLTVNQRSVKNSDELTVPKKTLGVSAVVNSAAAVAAFKLDQ